MAGCLPPMPLHCLRPASRDRLPGEQESVAVQHVLQRQPCGLATQLARRVSRYARQQLQYGEVEWLQMTRHIPAQGIVIRRVMCDLAPVAVFLQVGLFKNHVYQSVDNHQFVKQVVPARNERIFWFRKRCRPCSQPAFQSRAFLLRIGDGGGTATGTATPTGTGTATDWGCSGLIFLQPLQRGRHGVLAVSGDRAAAVANQNAIFHTQLHAISVAA